MPLERIKREFCPGRIAVSILDDDGLVVGRATGLSESLNAVGPESRLRSQVEQENLVALVVDDVGQFRDHANLS